MRRADLASPTAGLDEAGALLAAWVADARLPSATIEVGDARGVSGRLSIGAPDLAVYDLASLTKVLAPGLVAMRLVADRRLDLDTPVNRWLPGWQLADRADVRVRDLLVHASGLPAHLPLYASASGADAIVQASMDAPLACAPRSASIYSDLGFIVLGRVLEHIGAAPLDVQTTAVLSPVTDEPPAFGPVAPERAVQPTGRTAWRNPVPAGHVHDDNAAAMGGVAGHAGLFGTVRGVGRIAQTLLQGLQGMDTALAPSWLVRAFARRSPVPGSSRALAWDTALPSSSCGTRFTPHAIGHTGFTGTSIWIDPALDLYVVLLTNRVAGTATLAGIAQLRRAVHDHIAAARTGQTRG